MLVIYQIGLSQNYLRSPQEVQSEFKAYVDNLFRQIDKSKITSGLLADYALEWEEIAPYNGIPSDTNYVNLSTWINLYGSICNAKINSNISLEPPGAVTMKFKNATAPNNAVPLATMHYEYDRLDESAVQKGWLTHSNGQLREVAGKPSPYLKKQLFAVAPKELIFQSNTVSFVFKSNLFFRNNTKSIRYLVINFNNESGNKTVPLNVPISYTFPAGGQKTIYFRIYYTDGTSYISRTRIYVNSNSTGLRAGQTSLIDKKESIPASSTHSGGEMQIHFSKNNSSGKLKKPLIIAEPFDMSATTKLGTAYNLDYILYQSETIKNIIDTYLDYDVVYLNYNNGLDDIFRNAELLKEAIRHVNRDKDQAMKYPNVVIGISMGGLIARYALRSMEINNEDHDTWKYISLDAPHKGANFPLSMQAILKHAESLKKYLNVDILNELYAVLNSKAAKQMLIYYCNENVQLDNREHDAFQANYDAIGFPLKCQNIAVTNGSGKGTSLFAPYSELFSFNESYKWGDLIGATNNIFAGLAITFVALFDTFLNVITIGSTSFKVDLYLRTLPDKKIETIYNGHIYVKKTWLGGLFKTEIDVTHQTLQTNVSMLPLDGAAGSFNTIKYANINDARVDTLMKRILKTEFSFIPTSSSLALSNWQNYINKDIRNRDLYAEGLTEFEDYLISSDNHLHPEFGYAADFLAKHLASPPLSFDLASTSFSISALIPLKNPAAVPVTWSVSSNDFSLTGTNTSVTLFCAKPNITGTVTASNTVQVPAQIASAMGISNSFQMQQRKRMKSLGTASIDGSFQQWSSTAILRIPDLQAGIPVSWSLSNNSNFKIVSSAADSVVIEALSYSKTTRVTATLAMQGKQLTFQKDLTSPALSFYTPLLNCQESEISLVPRLSSYESVEWSVDPKDKYIKVTGATNQPTVNVYGYQNTGIHDHLKGKLAVTARVQGETIKRENAMPVAIPEYLDLWVTYTWQKGNRYSPSINHNVILIWALTTPNNDNGASYQWFSSQGRIVPCVPFGTATAYSLETTEFDAILSPTEKKSQTSLISTTAANQVSSQNISSTLLQTLLTEVAADNEAVKAEDIVITRSAVVSNSAGKVDAVVLGVSKTSASLENTASSNVVSSTVQSTANINLQDNLIATTVQPADKYITLYNPENMVALPPMPDPERLDIPYYMPENDPSYALLYYSGGNVTVTCNFISPCNEILSASVTISGNSFSCSYTPGSHSITIINDEDDDGSSEESSGGSYDVNLGRNLGSTTVKIGCNGKGTPYTYYDQQLREYVTIYPLNDCDYTVNIYNDYGLVKQVKYDASEGMISIPMYGYANGFYYVNIVDSGGNVVKSQTVQVR
jgi:hypothetical protein